MSPPDETYSLERWEELATNAVGEVIEFWGFKRNHGRTWALLYVRGRPLSAADIQEALELSKGAVSMSLTDLERWGVVRRMHVMGSTARHYEAETDFWRMISRVFRERELHMAERVRDDLEDAERLAAIDEVDAEILARLRRIKRLADLAARMLSVFLETSRVDVSGLRKVLSAGADPDKER